MALSRPARFLTLLFAAIQIAAPAFVSVADGAVARSARDAGSHVEEVGQNTCTPPHSTDCAVCRFLSAPVGDAPMPGSTLVSTEVPTPSAAFTAYGAAAARYGFDSRAPPTLLG